MNLPDAARCKNLGRPPGTLQLCRYCADTGLVVAVVRRDQWAEVAGEFEEFAPCPFCQQGYAEEFPVEERHAVWGKDGYWQGRDTPERIVPLNTGANEPLPLEENQRRMRELRERLAGVGKELPA